MGSHRNQINTQTLDADIDHKSTTLNVGTYASPRQVVCGRDEQGEKAPDPMGLVIDLESGVSDGGFLYEYRLEFALIPFLVGHLLYHHPETPPTGRVSTPYQLGAEVFLEQWTFDVRKVAT